MMVGVDVNRFRREGKCSECKRRRLVGSAQRYGGGDYRRPSRWYHTSICEECATRAIDYADTCTSDPSKVYMMSTSGLRALLGRPRPPVA